MLQDTNLYDEQRFLNVTLSDETKKLIKQNPQGKNLIYLNRLLLEDAYPDEIANKLSVIAPLKSILSDVKPESVMADEEKGKLIIELWESQYGCSIDNRELEFLFEAGKDTPQHWRNAYRKL